MQRKIDPFYRNLGEKLSEARKLKGYTQEELAIKIDRSREWVASVERGRQKLYVHDLLKMEKATRVIFIPKTGTQKHLIEKAEGLVRKVKSENLQPRTCAGLIVYMCQKEFQK